MKRIKANKDKVEISGSPEQVAADMIAIIYEFVAWENINSEVAGSEVQNVTTSLYETWKHAEEN